MREGIYLLRYYLRSTLRTYRKINQIIVDSYFRSLSQYKLEKLAYFVFSSSIDFSYSLITHELRTFLLARKTDMRLWSKSPVLARTRVIFLVNFLLFQYQALIFNFFSNNQPPIKFILLVTSFFSKFIRDILDVQYYTVSIPLFFFRSVFIVLMFTVVIVKIARCFTTEKYFCKL